MSRALDVVTLTGEEYDALCYEIDDLRNVLRSWSALRRPRRWPYSGKRANC